MDVLAGGTVAAHREAAVLLTRHDALPSVTQETLDALGVRGVIVGGPSAVSPEVEAQLVDQGPQTGTPRCCWSNCRRTASAPWSTSWGSTRPGSADGSGVLSAEAAWQSC